jgi:manganese oxidase
MRMLTQSELMRALLTSAAFTLCATAQAALPGIGGTPAVAPPQSCAGTPTTRTFDLTARSGHITLGDGNSLLAWGYSAEPYSNASNDPGRMQYPGPVLIVCQGDTVNVTLRNRLSDPVSIVFPGQSNVSATGGTEGLLTNEVGPFTPATPASVTYSFVATHAGTYIYHSGTDSAIQVEMGLVGALIVRPQGFVNGTYASHTTARRAYGSAATAYDVEYLFLLTEMDRIAHEQMEEALRNPASPRPNAADLKPTLWFINGRNGPDTMIEADAEWLPLQPYNSLPQMHPGDRVLMRLIGAGRDLHPFHHHGNNAWIIARDGRVLESAANSSANYPDYVGIPAADLAGRATTLPDQAVSNFTIQTIPGGAYDAIFTWTGKGLNWDIYGNRPGHTGDACNASTRLPFEDLESHCRPFPVVLPEQQSLTFGGFWSGSQYLGSLEPLPPMQGGLNPAGGYSFMWHSHTERELTNDDVFPGGMMTMLLVQAASSSAVIE